MDEKIEKRFENVSRSKVFNNILSLFDLKDKAVLDIGCTHGEFLKHFGPGSVGLTIMQSEVEYGRMKGLDVRNVNIEDKEVSFERKFDVIFANNLFEHMGSPHDFLRKLPEFLAEDGFIILGVPCVPKISWLTRLKKFRGSLASLHINFFTKTTLRYSVEYAGYRILDIRGYRFKNYIVDHCLDPIHPHFYVIAQPIKNFEYPEKRKKELLGYNE